MGKRIRVQRRGRGSHTFRARTHRRSASNRYPPIREKDEEITKGKIDKILHDTGRGTPLATLKLENGQKCHTVTPEGVHLGQEIQIGSEASIEIGNVLPLSSIPEGTIICNVELYPGDGGKIARSSGTYITVVAHTSEGAMIKLPSGKTRFLNPLCRATIGVVSGAGRVEKPFLKAGRKYKLMRARGRMYPRTRGVAMTAASHPYGSSKRGAKKVTTVSHHAPPGQKVGLIAARSTGKRKRRRKP